MKIVASVLRKLIEPRAGLLVWLAFMLFFGFASKENRPHGIHSWAQADRLAVAYYFYENDLDFFDPGTYSLNSDGGKVGVEFPAVQYLSAAAARVSGKEHLPVIYRWINYAVLILALIYFAFSIADGRIRWLVIWLISLSPVLLFYGFNFLPDSTSLSMSFLGMGAFLRSLNQSANSKRLRIYSLVFFGISALFKATSGIYLLIFGGYYIYSALRKKDYKDTFTLLGTTALLTLFVGVFDYFYVIKRNEKLWSVIFMSKSNPIDHPSDLAIIIKSMLNWSPEYFSFLNGLFVILGATVLLVHLFHNKRSYALMALFVLCITGIAGILFFFGKQFVNHDYYFVSSFYPMAAGSIYYVLKKGVDGLPGIFKPHWIWVILIGVFAVKVTRQASARGGDHYLSDNHRFDNNVEWMSDGGIYLDETGISRDAIIFVLYEDAPNLALLYFNRKGMTFNTEELSRDSSPLFYWEERLNPAYYIVQKKWLHRLDKDLEGFSDKHTIVQESDSFIVLN